MGTTWERTRGPLPSTANCTIHWIVQPLDHFSWPVVSAATFNMRYYTYANWWKPGQPVFFYAGNEADVGLYVNSTGLIWENAEKFGALIVFAEHRYYGASLPVDAGGRQGTAHQLQYLSHELALADFVVLVDSLRREHSAEDSPFIAFGGSYGGKLAAWMRMKYPAAIAGAISASAPLLGFPGEKPSWDSGSYYRAVTRTAEHYSENCGTNIKAAFPLLDQEAATVGT